MKRDLNLDSLKGFLIILVVFGHFPFEFFSIEKPSILINFIAFVYFFHMPLFLSISTLFIKSDYNWLIKRASLILTPYLFWFLYYHWPILITAPNDFFTKLFMGNWASLKSVFWYLPALFSLNVLFFLFYKQNKFFKIIFIAISFLVYVSSNKIMLLHDVIPFGIDVALYIFMLTLFIKFVYLNRNWLQKINITLTILIIIISSLILFYLEPIKMHTQWHSRIDLAQFSVPITIIGYITFIILNVFFFLLFFKIKSNQILSFVGIYSFPIFILHLIILYKLPLSFKFDNIILNTLFMLVTFILSIILPIVFSKFLMRISDKFKYIGLVK